MNSNFYKYGSSSVRHINTTVDAMQALCHEAMRIANHRMLYIPDFGISDGLRSTADQKARYAKGRDQNGRILYLGHVITYRDGVEKKSYHQTGHAIDFFTVGFGGQADYTAAAMTAVYSCFAEAAMNLGLVIKWGGNYGSFEDLGHISLMGEM